MAQELLVTTTFEHLSGFPEDRIVNTFPIAWTAAGSPASGDLTDLFQEITDFWNVVRTTLALAAYLSDEVDRTAGSAIIRVYDLVGHLDGSAHGSPIASSTFTPAASAAAFDLPAECAVVLTTRATGWATAPVEVPDGADPGSEVDRPRQRLSGRNFIGPLTVEACSMVSNAIRVKPQMVTDLLDAAEGLADSLVTENFRWMVWSRVNQAMEPVTHFQVDNAFDTMRKRGPDPTLRTTRAL